MFKKQGRKKEKGWGASLNSLMKIVSNDNNWNRSFLIPNLCRVTSAWSWAKLFIIAFPKVHDRKKKKKIHRIIVLSQLTTFRGYSKKQVIKYLNCRMSSKVTEQVCHILQQLWKSKWYYIFKIIPLLFYSIQFCSVLKSQNGCDSEIQTCATIVKMYLYNSSLHSKHLIMISSRQKRNTHADERKINIPTNSNENVVLFYLLFLRTDLIGSKT